MTTLANADWFSRRMIPEDVREAHKAALGSHVSHASAALHEPTLRAKQEFRDWDAEVSSRIERLRSKARGEGERSLTPRQAHALAASVSKLSPDFALRRWPPMNSFVSPPRHLIQARASLSLSSAGP